MEQVTGANEAANIDGNDMNNEEAANLTNNKDKNDENVETKVHCRVNDMRISETWISFQIPFSSSISQVVVLEGKRVFIYYQNGIAQVFSLKTQQLISSAQMSTSLVHFQFYDNDTVLCVNLDKCILQLINVDELKPKSKESPRCPSESIWQLCERSARKIQDFISSGLEIRVLKDSKRVILMEQKSVVSSLNEYLLTVFDFNSPESLFQIAIPDEKQRGLYLTLLDETNNIALWHSSDQKENVEILVLDILSPVKKFKSLNYEILSRFDAVAATVFSATEVGIWFNGVVPSVLICDWVSGSNWRLITLELSNMCREGALLKDVYVLHYFTYYHTALLTVQTTHGEILHLVNLEENRTVFSKRIANEQAMTFKVPSPCRNYLVEYERDSSRDDDQTPSTAEFSVSQILRVRTSILNCLIQKDIPELYGDYACHQIINMLTNIETTEDGI